MGMKMDITSTLTLNNGVKIPRLGFGTYQVRGQRVVERIIKNVLKAGYRHIDTASVYGNEKYIGHAIKKSGIDRLLFFHNLIIKILLLELLHPPRTFSFLIFFPI